MEQSTHGTFPLEFGSLQLMDLRAWCEFGHLQEVNRAYFHPRGMALTLVLDDELREPYLVVQSTDDKEGWIIDPVLPETVEKARRVQAELEEKKPVREHALGYWIQPIDEVSETEL